MSGTFAAEDFARFEAGTKPGAHRPTERVDGRVIGEGERHHWLTKRAGKMRKAGLSPAEIEVALLQSNAERCRPPSPDAEVRQIARDIGEKPSGAAVELIRPRLLTAEEFDADLAPESIVMGILYIASTTLLTGASKAGKTWQAIQLAMCIAAGLPFLGLAVRQVIVLYLSLEPSAGMLRERMRAISRDVGIPMPEVGRAFHVMAPTADYLPRLDLASDEGGDFLRSLIAEAKAQVVVIDTLYRFIPGSDPIDNGQMGEIFGRLNDLAQSTGAAFLILDHVGKGEQSGPVSHSALGASVKGGAVRVIAGLKRTSKEDGGRWEINVESHFGSWEEPLFYERPKRADGSRGAGCIGCTATEAHVLSFEKVRDLFARFAERIDGRVVFTSKRKLIDGLIAARIASGVAQAEEIITAIRRDYCAPESSGWRGADRPIRTSTGPRNAVVFVWGADLDESTRDA